MSENPFWSNRIIGFEEVAPDQLLAHPKNVRRHPKSQQDAQAEILERLGWIQTIIVNKRTETLIDGHMRVELAMRNEQPTVPVGYIDVSPEEEEELLALYDQVGSMAYLDREALGSLLGDIKRTEDDRSAELWKILERQAQAPTATDFLAKYASTNDSANEARRSRTPDDIVSLEFALSPDDRAAVMRAIAKAKADHAFETSPEAIVFIARDWLGEPV